jgi:WG containing repeat
MKSFVGVGRIRNPGFLIAAAFGLFPSSPNADGPPTITPVTIGRTQGFRDAAGTLVIGAEFRVCESAKGEAAALTIDGKRGYIDPAGRLVMGSAKLPPPEAEVVRISKIVTEATSGEKKRKWGFADGTGRIVVEPQFDEIQGFTEGIGRVVKDRRYGFVDSKGRILVPPRYKRAYWFSEGVSCVTLDDDRRAYVDSGGNVVSDPSYEYRDAPFMEGRAPARSNGKWGYVDRSWKLVVPPRFDSVGFFSEGLATVVIDGLTAVIDRAGKIVIEPRPWHITAFSEGLAAFVPSGGGFIVRIDRDDRWGYIDREGRVVIPPRFVRAMQFLGGIARVTESREIEWISGGCWNGYDLINRFGEYVWKSKRRE